MVEGIKKFVPAELNVFYLVIFIHSCASQSSSSSSSPLKKRCYRQYDIDDGLAEQFISRLAPSPFLCTLLWRILVCLFSQRVRIWFEQILKKKKMPNTTLTKKKKSHKFWNRQMNCEEDIKTLRHHTKTVRTAESCAVWRAFSGRLKWEWNAVWFRFFLLLVWVERKIVALASSCWGESIANVSDLRLQKIEYIFFCFGSNVIRRRQRVVNA